MRMSVRVPRAASLLACALPLAVSPGSGSAQTTPGSDVPALMTPAQIAPFDTLQLSPGTPLRQVPPRVPSPPDSAFIPPVPAPDGRLDLTLSARFVESGPEIGSGLQWRVFHDEADQNGDLPLAEDSTESAPSFRLAPGGYVIHAVYGLASVSKHVVVEQSVREQLVMPAGAVKLLAVVGEQPIDPGKVTFKLAANDGGVERAIADNLRAQALVRLPAGMYHVVSNFGDANAVVEVDVRVEPGKLVEATVHHKAAAIGLRLLESAGGEFVDNTSWSVLTPGGDVVREAITPQPSFVLAEGKYIAMARHDGRSYSREFTVLSGHEQQLDIVQGDASAVRTPPGGGRPAAAGGEGMDEAADASLD